MVYPNGRTIDYSYGSGMRNANAAINNLGSWTPITSSIEPITFGQSFNDLLSGEGFAARALQIAPNMEQQLTTASLLGGQPDGLTIGKNITPSVDDPQTSNTYKNDLYLSWMYQRSVVSLKNTKTLMPWITDSGSSIPRPNSIPNDPADPKIINSWVFAFAHQEVFGILLNPRVNK